MSRKKALNEMRLEFLSDSRNESFARSTVCAFASQLDPTVGELTEIRTAVSEAVTNAIIHGYRGRSGHRQGKRLIFGGRRAAGTHIRQGLRHCRYRACERAAVYLGRERRARRNGLLHHGELTDENDGKVRSRARNDRHTYQAHRAKQQCRLKHRCVKREPRQCRSSRSLQ